jgi:WD40 repeat protein
MVTQPPSKSSLQLLPLAEFKPIASSRAWVSVPNPNNLPLIATATSDKTVRVYSLKNFTLHSILEGGHSRSVRTVAWKPETKNNGTLVLASGSFDQTVGLWRRREPQSNEEIRGGDIETSGDTLEQEITSFGGPRSEPDSDRSENEDDWEFSLVLEGQENEIKSVAYSPSGQYLASCSRDKSIWIWEEVGEEGEDEWETIAVLQEHTGDVKTVCWRENDGNGEVLASASYDDTIRLWREVEEGEWASVAELEGHEGTVWSLDWEPVVSQKMFESSGPDAVGDADAEGYPDTPSSIPRLISTSADCTIRIWSLAPSPPQPNRPSYLNPSIPSTMRPLPANEKWVCTATLPKVHDLPVYSINWSKKTGRVVSTGGDGKIAIYEERKKGRTSVGGEIEREWVVLSVLAGCHGPYEINHATWCTRYDSGKTKDGEEIVISTGDDGVVRAWFIEEGEAPVSLKDPRVEQMSLEDKVEAVMDGKSIS